LNIINIPIEKACDKCGFHGEFIRVEDAYDYVMQNDYESVCEAVMEQEGQNEHDMRMDRD